MSAVVTRAFIDFSARSEDEEAERASAPPRASRVAEKHESLDLDLLDAVSGGLALPQGGTISERQTPYSWWGMQYTQTERTAYDAHGNAVGSEVVRPGSVWSDRTETRADGSAHTTYDVGGNGLAAQISTTHDSNGNFSGAGFDARANVGVGDFSLTGNLRGGVEVGRDAAGLPTSLGLNGHADAGITHDPTGLGVRVGADANAQSSLSYNDQGQLTGFSGNASFAVPAEATLNGERLAGLNLVGAHAGIHGEQTDNGFSLGADAGRTILGTSINGEAHLQTGDGLSFGGSADFNRQILGPYGARAGASAGFDANVGGSNPGFEAGANAHASVLGVPLAQADANVSVNGDGISASASESHVPLPDISSIPLPDHLPSLPSIPVPDIRLPDHLPDVHANPTGLPGTNGYEPSQGASEQQPSYSNEYSGSPQASNYADTAPVGGEQQAASSSETYGTEGGGANDTSSYTDAGTSYDSSSDSGASYADAGSSDTSSESSSEYA